MNKVFLDPNTKYSDQYAMLAKMPGIVDAVNDVADKVEDIPEIPAPAVADIGKVLGVVSDGESGAEYGAVEQSSGLPAISAGDAGKVLTVNAGETGAEWDSVDALPAIAAGDAGKVLTVNAGETAAEWSSPSGGEGASVYYGVSDPEYQHTITTPPTNIVAPPTGATWEVDQNSTYDWYLTDANNVPLTADQIQQVKVGDIVVVNNFNSYYPGSYLKGIVVGLKDVNAVDEYDQGWCQRSVYFQNVDAMGPSAAGYASTAYNNL